MPTDPSPAPHGNVASRSARRGFLAQLAATLAAVVAGGAAAPHLRAQDVAPVAPDSGRASPGTWDMSWVDRLTAKRRQVFDCPEINEGTALHQARVYLSGYADVYGLHDGDLNAVIVVRHKAIPMVLGDAAWNAYEDIGKKITKLKDPTTGKDAHRNPFLNAKPDDKYAMVWPDGGLDTLITRGVIVLACNMALHAFSGQLATKTSRQADDVYAQLKAALVPGVTLMPSGVFAVARAEEAGCAYLTAAG